MTARVCKLLKGRRHEHRWVFTAAPSRKHPNGNHQISERRLLRSLKRLLKRLNIAGHLHTFRHAFISHSLSTGVPEAVRNLDGAPDSLVATNEADEAGQEPNAPADSRDLERNDEDGSNSTV